ncbi:MAG: hypothetical protein SFV54_06155 [Bryobacteraceae bacterium]|nr:hypothetical protein [Bryobacteraceae bacterium]
MASPSMVKLEGQCGEWCIAVVEDYSDLGLGVSAAVELTPGSMWLVRGKQGTRSGIVRWCAPREQDGCYTIGLEFLGHATGKAGGRW